MKRTKGKTGGHRGGSGLSLVFFFFFQPEDGIRDTSVTGVQTCALPIFRGHGDGRAAHPQEDVLRQITRRLGLANRPAEVLEQATLVSGEQRFGVDGRSEERRVGKECRARWSR